MAPSKKKKRAARKRLAGSQPGHRLDGCRSAAAQEILRLRQLVKSKPKPQVRPSNRMDRQHRKRKRDKSSAHFDYTKKSARCSPAQRRTLDERSWSTHLQGIKHGMSTLQAAHRLLMKAGFLHKPRQCLACEPLQPRSCNCQQGALGGAMQEQDLQNKEQCGELRAIPREQGIPAESSGCREQLCVPTLHPSSFCGKHDQSHRGPEDAGSSHHGDLASSRKCRRSKTQQVLRVCWRLRSRRHISTDLLCVSQK